MIDDGEENREPTEDDGWRTVELLPTRGVTKADDKLFVRREEAAASVEAAGRNFMVENCAQQRKLMCWWLSSIIEADFLRKLLLLL